jgi:hypothetical protein
MIQQPETCNKLKEVLEEFSMWAHDRISGYTEMPYMSERGQALRQGKIDGILFSESNLTRIINKIFDKEDK